MASIDYRVKESCADHKYIKDNYGFEIKMNYDCTFTCKELPGLSLSSYGDWGTLYLDGKEGSLSQKIFDEMINKGIIFIWRINK